MRVRVKIQKNRHFKPVIHWQREMYWVHLHTGGYFHVIMNEGGTWSHPGNYHRRVPTVRDAIQEYLEIEAKEKAKSRHRYRALRVKEKVFAL